MSPFEQFAFTGWSGESVHGFVVKPADYQPGRKYPVAFLIHGGPHGTFCNACS
jgi:dipeptidyl aminopeptidase/acylaminoacyl peptidase